MIAYKSINPFTGELLKEFKVQSDDNLGEVIETLNKGFGLWKKVDVDNRIEFIKQVKFRLLEKKEVFAELITLEMGKPIVESRAEIDKCASLCDYYILNGRGFLGSKKILISGAEAEVLSQPLGGVLAIMPWNFPFWQVFRFAIPNLIVGNVCALKHAPNVPQCAEALEELFKNDIVVFVNLFLSNEQVGAIIKNDVIQGVTLTGSNKAGEVVGKVAGEQIKKVVLELGGNDAFVVYKDADLDQAAEKLLISRFLNTGQSCIGAKRLLVHSAVKDDFLEKLIQLIKDRLKFGDPLLESTTLGVIAREDLKNNLDEQVSVLIANGGKVLFEQKLTSRMGAFPLLLIDTTNISIKHRDMELFGPVLQVNEFENDEEVVTFVNETSFGLGCSIWSRDIQKIKDLSLLIDVGSVFLNEMVFSSPYLPFGGVKKSGVGRELAKEGMLEFTNVKTIFIKNN